MIRFFKNDIFTDCGSPIKITYSPVVNDDGYIELIESGKENWQEYIQSFYEDCDISVLVRRIANGEVDLLNRRQGTYGDFTNMPKTYAEILQLTIDSENYFKSLPVEVRNKFDNDKNVFFAKTGTEEWFNILNSMYVSKYDDKENMEMKEVKDES